ncbi:MAG: SusD/RagB family nutrient-binding outer membrane lipoprotein, partial [Muribaculaceae bacterium]|nr:SusD/RagB family nutrient-binding outer membrane lipoprotein [Muribaculaceae bacterium]
MKISSLISLIAAGLLMTAGACTDAEMDRLNRNTSNPPAETVNARFQITDAIVSTGFSNIGGSYAWYISSYNEQMFGDGNNLLMYAELRDPGVTAAATTFNNDWNTIYRNLQNVKQIIEKCGERGLNAGQLDLLGMAE